ncbi:ribbon-helix-helix protein [Microbacterium elymi]|uniref:Uncharacterized protein n=1 Tax=Microbacterium elymi TaxID=2909587 RepID=A0ABY5NMX2_9MICO|nr:MULTISPECIES: hypothetical protein [Microbacterium]UUT36444.1 hypothetical protein L2X98_26380 [Microbacterium elymi]
MTTTIKVSDELRDRLKAQASQAGLTLGAHLAELADLADRRDRLAAAKQAMASSPAGVDEYREETRRWEAAELTDAQHD